MAVFTFPQVPIDTTGLATEANQVLMITELTDINTELDAQSTTLTSIDGKVSTEAKQDTIIAAQATLESAVAKESKQDVANASLSSIDTDTGVIAGDTTSIDGKITACDTGAVTISAALPTGANSVGTVGLDAGTNSVGTVGLDTGTNSVGTVGLDAGTNTIGNVNVNAISPIDFLDSGVLDSSSTNIPAAGVTVVASLAADCMELEIVDDIGEYMVITDGADAILAYLPLGGGRVKLSISSGTVIKLASRSGSTISSGSIAINFLG